MAEQQNDAGMVDATARRKWDKEEYARRARDRLEEEERQLNKDLGIKQVIQQRPNLKAREEKVVLDKGIGKSRIVESQQARGSGYYCDVCDCVLKDSITYLDHINGKPHQKKLGLSMRVDKSSKEEVQEKLAELKRKMDAQKRGDKVEYNLRDRMAALEEQEQQRKREKRERRKAKRRDGGAAGNGAAKRPHEMDGSARDEDDDIVAEAANADMAAMMGFSGFGGGN